MGQEAAETAVFVSLMDKFFDIMNVSNFATGITKRKPFQYPYRSADDPRLKVHCNTGRMLYTRVWYNIAESTVLYMRLKPIEYVNLQYYAN